MKKIQRFVWVLLGLAGLVGGTSYAGIFSDSWRYRMTVTVETPEGIKTGSAVREVKVIKGLKLTPQMLPEIEVKGEAVVVDLGKRGVLFMLVDGDYGADILFKMFPGEDKKGKITLTPEQYPMFAMLKDLNNPMTVEQVCEKTFCEKVQWATGRKTIDFDQLGVSVKEVTIEITREPVTWGIDKRLPWLGGIKGGYLDGKFAGGGPALSNILHGGHFKRGEK